MKLESSEKFLDWFDGSIVVDERGKPLEVFRGQHGSKSNSLESRRGSFSFSDREVAEFYALHPNDARIDSFAKNPRVISAYVRIVNPFIDSPDDPFIDLSAIRDALGFAEVSRIAVKFSSDIQNTDLWDEEFSKHYKDVKSLLKDRPKIVGELYFYSYRLFDDQAEVLKIKSYGFDGAISSLTGAHAGTPEYRVFDEDAVWVTGIEEI